MSLKESNGCQCLILSRRIPNGHKKEIKIEFAKSKMENGDEGQH